MAYWLDEGWHGWPEIDAVGTAAAGLYARCGAYIADRKTDGFIPIERARMYGTPEWIGRLVEAGLWAIEERGYRDLRYLELNATKVQIDQRKADAAARQAKRRASRVSHTDVTRDSRASHNAPNPPPKGGKGRGLAAVPDWCGRCHRDTRMAIDDDDRSTPCETCHPRRTA